jgi:hypothetical protein
MNSGVSFGELVLSCQGLGAPERGIISRAEALVATHDFFGLTGLCLGFGQRGSDGANTFAGAPLVRQLFS